jgi:hypothetical protein
MRLYRVLWSDSGGWSDANMLLANIVVIIIIS